ncbi:MAG: SMI1/KNR4 family protein [Alphaproteobacteria bacterium]|nr:SMI1/KNR4 family protein [Alphaproteobacteria bacterium]OJV47846.1 MAG: hypothetical protein BGO28_01095 [Alphaproteobacteria bacterium 43-37]
MEFEKNFGPLNENVLEALEQVWEFKLPSSYRDFLLRYNGGIPVNDTFYFKKDPSSGSIVQLFLGVTPEKHANLLGHLRTYQGRILDTMFPIAYDPSGNLILLVVKGPDREKVFFWDHELEADSEWGQEPNYSNLTLVADSFEEFVANLKFE